MPAEPIFLYLHGFASHVGSAKGTAFARWAEPRGTAIERLDLRVPSFENLRFSAMKTVVRDAIDRAGGPRARAVLIGSSLGALTALRVAEEDPRVAAIFAMAPAFRLAERWKSRLGDDWDRWEREGSIEVDDHKTGGKSRVGFGFAEELSRVDQGWPDVRVPTRIVHGTRDDVVDVELSREWSKDKRHVRLVEVDDGHDLMASLDTIFREAVEFMAPFGI